MTSRSLQNTSCGRSPCNRYDRNVWNWLIGLRRVREFLAAILFGLCYIGSRDLDAILDASFWLAFIL